MFKGIEHVGILARDSEKLAQWYQQTLGWHAVWVSETKPRTFFLASENRSMVEIIPTTQPVPAALPELPDPGHRHLAIAVDDFDKACAALQAKKVSFIEPPKEGAGGAKVVFFRDCEGNILHLIRRPTPLV